MTAFLQPVIDVFRVHGGDTSGDGADLPVMHQRLRRLLSIAGTLLSVLLCAALAIVVGGLVYRQQQDHLQDFQRARVSLEARLSRHDASYDRLASMAGYAWQHRTDSDPAMLADDARRYLAEGQRLLVQDPARGAPQLVLGSDTERWPAERLRRYLALARSMSSISAMAFDVPGEGAPGAMYFLDPTGHLAILDQGRPDGGVFAALLEQDRPAMLSQLQAYARVPSPVVAATGVGALRKDHDLHHARMGVVAHSRTGRRLLVTAIPVHDGTRGLGMLVGIEPAATLAESLRQESGGNISVIGPDGQVILGSRGSVPKTLLQALHDGRRWSQRDTGVRQYRRGGQLLIAAPVVGSDWSLVTVLGWRDMFAECHRALAIAVAVWAVLVAVVWLLMAGLDRRVLAPAMRRAGQVHADERLLRSLVQMIPAGLCLIDRKQALPVVQNEVMRRHADAAQRCGMDLYAALEVGQARALADPVYGGDPDMTEFELSLPASEHALARHLLVAATEVVHDGRTVLLCVLQDLSGRVELQAQKDLLRDQAEQAHRDRSRFLAAMSHEIRTPLHGILGHLELFARSHLDTEQRARLHRITQSADALLLIINDVLDLERAESDQLGLEVVRFEPALLIERVAMLYAPLALGKGVDLDLMIDPGLARWVVGPMARVEQVLRNLVSNAIKFTPSGRIEIRLLPSVQPGGLRWEVADSGIGLTARQQENLFEPFIQADASIAGRFGGSGLGLSLCRQLCRLMGGDIDVHSTPGVGSVFGFDVQLLSAAAEAARRPGPMAGRRVLLQSTVTSWREELARRLRGWDADVVVVESPGPLDQGDDAAGLPVVVFERNLRAGHPEQATGVERTVRVRSDGPLKAAWRDGIWEVSAYSAASLLEALLDDGLGVGRVDAPMAPMATRAVIG